MNSHRFKMRPNSRRGVKPCLGAVTNEFRNAMASRTKQGYIVMHFDYGLGRNDCEALSTILQRFGFKLQEA